MAREVFNPNATDGDGDGMVQDGTEFERPAGEMPEGFNPDATDGDGDGMVQDGTEFERPVDSAKADDNVIKADEPVETQPSITIATDGVIGTGTTEKKPKAKKEPVVEGEKVALFSEKNIYWESVGRILKGYNIVDANVADKWLGRSYIRLATPEEVKQEFGK